MSGERLWRPPCRVRRVPPESSSPALAPRSATGADDTAAPDGGVRERSGGAAELFFGDLDIGVGQDADVHEVWELAGQLGVATGSDEAKDAVPDAAGDAVGDHARHPVGIGHLLAA